MLPTFTWGAVASAASYDIQVASDPAFATIVASATGLASTSYTPGAPLTPATAYYWRVRANNVCGSSSYSALAAFMTANVATASFCRSPNLAIPDNNVTGVTDSQVVATAATLTDLNVSVRIDAHVGGRPDLYGDECRKRDERDDHRPAGLHGERGRLQREPHQCHPGRRCELAGGNPVRD